jgi:hypothetical protein
VNRKRSAGTDHPVSTVSVRLRRLGQLFNSLDPSPFWDRDLDKDAAEFIEAEYRDRPRDHAWLLNVTTSDLEGYSQHDVQEAVKHYYQRSAESIRRQTRERYRIGRLSIALGVAVFLFCMIGRQLLQGLFPRAVPSVLREGLIVLAWIALWLPIEHFISELAPLVRERRFVDRLAQIRVHVRLVRPSHETPVVTPADGGPVGGPDRGPGPVPPAAAPAAQV